MSVLKESMGELFHTALRKGCDSKWSSAMWKAFQLCPSNVYSYFIQHLIDNAPEDDVVTSTWIKECCESYDMYGTEYRIEHNKDKWVGDESTWSVMIKCMLEIMPDDDAEGIAGFINYCVEYSG